MPARRWVLFTLVALAVLAVVFLATGGVYRTINAGGGRVYVVNRFTGRTQVVRGDVVAPLKTETQARREEVKAREEEEKRAAVKREDELQEAARAANCQLVGDRTTELYHRGTGINALLLPDSPSEVAHESSCLAKVVSPVYFSNILDATKRGYMPCQKCLPSEWRRVAAAKASVLLWPHTSAPVDFTVAKRGSVQVLGEYGDYCAVSTVRVATGKPGVGWVLSSSLSPRDE